MMSESRRIFCAGGRAGRGLCAIVAACWLVPWPAGAAAPAPAPVAGGATISLEECLRAGLDGNAGIAALRAEIAASGAGRRAAEAGYWPRIYGEAAFRRSDNPVIVFGDKLTAGEFTAADFAIDSLNDPDAIDHGMLAVGVEVPLDVTGGTGAGIAAARGGEAAAAARLEAAAVDLAARIIEAYYGVALADAAVVVAREALDRAARHEDVAAARAARGEALRAEPLRARAARLERGRDLERRTADAALVRARLAVLMGEPGRAIDATEPIPPQPGDPGALEDWLEGAATRPDVAAARLWSHAAAETARAARATRGPAMAGTARYERNAGGLDGGDGSYVVGVSVRWNAFDGGRGPRIEEAAAQGAAAAARARVVEDGARLEIESAWREAGVADAALVSATEGAAAAEEARRITSERYAAGFAPLTDLLDTENSAAGTRLAALAAQYDALVARVRLRRSAGRLELPGGTEASTPGGATPAPAGEGTR